MPRKGGSKQECFASDLAGTDLGVAIYSPLPFGSPLPPAIIASLGLLNLNTDHPRNSGKVGDIAFFDQDGKYQWLRNAFHTAVTRQLVTI